MICRLSVSLLHACLLVGQTAGGNAAGTVRGSVPASQRPANAAHVAEVLGISEEVQRLEAGSFSCSASTVLRQQVTESVVIASLDAASTLAEIDFERAQIADVQAQLTSRRDRRTGLLSMANIVAGAGPGVIGNAMQFSNRTAMAGDAVGVAAGTAGVILSVLSLRVTGGAQPLPIAPNMLAPLFGRKTELRSVYPEDVWKYLNTAPSNDPRIHVPWREELIAGWVSDGRIGSPEDAQSQKKIDQITSTISGKQRLSIDVLNDRGAMLTDLRSRVGLMNRDLRDLMKVVAGMPLCASGPRE